MSHLTPVSEYLSKIDDLPLVLTGPILRRTESNAVTIWLALKKTCSVVLKVYATEDDLGATLGKVVLQGTKNTIQAGQNLYIVAVTAKPIENHLLEPGRIYAYDLDFNVDFGSNKINLITALKVRDFEDSISYFAHQLPTFALPPDNLNHLRIVHGSCRKPHGGGKDAMPCLDNLIQESASLANQRPHQLFLTGDQIYGDDVADPMLWLAQGVSELLLGWSEELPLIEGSISSDQLTPGKRTTVAGREGGLTAMISKKSGEAKSHLFSFGEYAAAYLLAWSPVLMPHCFPDGNSLFRSRQQAKKWDQEVYDTNSFINDLGRVRRALANVPTYTICDDHDISDDWYLNREWCDRVLSKPLGKRVVQNGLLAYALFQAWGNTPEQFEKDTKGRKLLQAASTWLASQGKDLAAKSKCDRYLGIPPINSSTGLPKLQQDEDVLILARDSQAISWHYSISSSKHEVIVLDTRTWRGYPPGDDQKLAPPMLLSHTAFEQQLQIPLEQTKPDIEATIIVLPTNFVALSIIDRIQHWELSRNKVFSSDVGDSWNFHQEAFAQLLLSLCQRRDRVIILSGDIHYSCAVRLTHWFHSPLKTSVLVQLTSSAIKNSELATSLVHSKLKFLLPEKTERYLGWQEPLKINKIRQLSLWQRICFWRKEKYPSQQDSLPDWQYRIEWCKRQPYQSLPWQQPELEIEDKPNLWQRFTKSFLFLLWRNPWLQEGPEVVGKSNLSLVRFEWSETKTVVQETYWHPPWNDTSIVRSSYVISLEPDPLPPLPKTK